MRTYLYLKHKLFKTITAVTLCSFMFGNNCLACEFDKISTLRPRAVANANAVDLRKNLPIKASSAGAVDNPLTYIERANKNIAEGNTFDAIIITAVDNDMAQYLRGHFEQLKGKLFPKDAIVEVISRQELAPKVYKEIYNHDGTVQAMDYVLGHMKEWRLTEKSKILVLHTAGSGSRNYPITAAAKGNKGLMEVPSEIGGIVLTQVDQAIRQYYQILDDTPEGTFTIGTCDHIFAIADNMSGRGSGLEVFGNKRFLGKTLQELDKIDVIDINSSHGKIIYKMSDSNTQAIINPIIESDHKKAPNFYGITTLGQIWTNSKNEILEMIEKPQDWPTIKRLIEKGYTNINWWNHRYSFKAARIATELYTPFIGEKLDFSIDILQAFTQSSLDEWLILKLKLADEYPDLTKEELINNVTQAYRDKYAYIYELAQKFRRMIGNLGYIDAGKNSLFIDTGTNSELFYLYMNRFLDSKDAELLKQLFGISQDNFVKPNVICIASDYTREAIQEGKITFGENARAIFIGSNIAAGHIVGKGFIVNSETPRLDMIGDGIAWSIRNSPKVVVEDGYIVADVYHNSAIERSSWRIARKPTTGAGNPYERLAPSIQKAGPIEIERVIGLVKASSAGISLADRDLEHINLAAKIADLSKATGTIVYNDIALSLKQQKMLHNLIGIGTPRLAELEAKLGCSVKLMSQGGIEDNAKTIIISTEKLSNFKNTKYFITEQTQIDTSYVAIAPLIAIAKGLLGLESRTEQPKLYAALKSSIKSLSQGLLNEKQIEAAITAYINGNPMFIKLPLPVSYDYDQLEQLQRQAFMVLIAV